MKNGEKKYIFFLDFECPNMSDTRCQTHELVRYVRPQKSVQASPGLVQKAWAAPKRPRLFLKILVPVISGFRLFLGCLTIVRQYSKMRARIKKSFLFVSQKYVYDCFKKYFGESQCLDFSVKSPEHTRFCLTFFHVSDIAATGDIFLSVRHN